MAKGLVLCHQEEDFSGESAGFGLPVLKTKKQTIFPSLFSSTRHPSGSVEAVYHLNRINTWQIAGFAAPALFSDFMEKTVNFYMRHPEFQSAGLTLRNTLFKFFKIESTMISGKSFGYCRVFYQAKNLQLKISVNGQGLKNPDQLILLNEVPGSDFTRLIIPNGNVVKIFDGDDFLPWQTCSIEAAVENPGLQIGFFLSLPESRSASNFGVAAGREVGQNLNWAGLSLSADLKTFTYFVNFYQSGSIPLL
jgi:hypothetical protein